MMIYEWMMSELWLNHNHHSGMIRETWLMMMIYVWIMSDSWFTHVSWFNNHHHHSLYDSWIMSDDVSWMNNEWSMSDYYAHTWMNHDWL